MIITISGLFIGLVGAMTMAAELIVPNECKDEIIRKYLKK